MTITRHTEYIEAPCGNTVSLPTVAFGGPAMIACSSCTLIHIVEIIETQGTYRAEWSTELPVEPLSSEDVVTTTLEGLIKEHGLLNVTEALEKLKGGDSDE